MQAKRNNASDHLRVVKASDAKVRRLQSQFALEVRKKNTEIDYLTKQLRTIYNPYPRA